MPQKINYTWEQICTFDSLYTAWKEVKREKSERGLILRYENNLVSNLERVLETLKDGSYRPKPHYEFTLRDTKARLIHAPHLEDRIVQHAVCNAIRLPVQNKLIHHTYSCLIGRGVHKCSEQLSHYLSTGRYKYYLKADVSKFFYSIDHDALMGEVRRVFKCLRTIEILELFIKVNGKRKGIPIGASTSQILANLALNPLDHHARRNLGIGTYLRYCDDMVAVFPSKVEAKNSLEGIKQKLESLGMHLNPSSHVGFCSDGIDWVGYRHWPEYRLVRKSTIRRIRRRLKTGPLDHDALASYLSHGLKTSSLNFLCHLCSPSRAYYISEWLKAK